MIYVAYEDLLKSVEESAREKEAELRKREQAAVDEIRTRAKRQAAAIRQSSLDNADKSISTERNKLLYLTKAENKELLIRIRENAFERAFSEAKGRLKSLRSDPNYPSVFEHLLREAADAIGGTAFVIHIDPRDEAICKKTCPQLSLSAGIRTDLVTDGGVELSLPDNSVLISNTVESRLHRIKELRRKEIHGILTGA